MTRILLFTGATLGGWLGWMLGEQVGLMTAVILGGVGSVLGILGTWKLYRRWLD
jgi:hypothetical protein